MNEEPGGLYLDEEDTPASSSSSVFLPALPNTLESTMALFPMGIPHVQRRKRNRQSLDENEVSGILYPSEEAILGDLMQRVQISPVKKMKTDAINAMNERIMNSCPVWKFPKGVTMEYTLKEQQVLSTKQVRGAAAASIPVKNARPIFEALLKPAAPPPDLQPPNEFGVQIIKPYELFDYQKHAVQWLIDREEGRITLPCYDPQKRGGLACVAMGLGKTIISGALVMRSIAQQRQERSCTLYVCPKNLLGTVRFQYEKFFGPQLKILIYHRDFLRSTFNTHKAQEFAKYDLVLTNYNTVVSQMKKIGPEEFTSFRWFRIFVDESHEIREKNTEKFKACNALQSPRRFCLTGTPIFNKIDDLFHQLEFTGLQVPSGHKRIRSLLDKLNLMQMILFIEYKDAKSVTLPKKTVHNVYFELSPEEKFLHGFYMKSAQKACEEIGSQQTVKEKNKRSFFVQQWLIRLMQICSAPYLVTPASKKAEIATDDDDMAQVEPIQVFPSDGNIDTWIQNGDGPAGKFSSKMKKFLELIGRLRTTTTSDNNLKVVVFANYSSTLRLAISAAAINDPDFDKKHVYIHGGIQSAHKREELYTKFRLDPQVEFLFTTLKLGSVGLNLNEANRVIFLECWFSYSSLAQGEARCWRIGQMRPVDVFYLLAQDSIEERIYRTAMEKKDMAEDVMQDQQPKQPSINEMKHILFHDFMAEDSKVQ